MIPVQEALSAGHPNNRCLNDYQSGSSVAYIHTSVMRLDSDTKREYVAT